MVRLIINADDLGYAKVNNDAIFELMDDGKITSATLMTNADGFEDAVAKWEVDRKFVFNYKSGDCPEIIVRKLTIGR